MRTFIKLEQALGYKRFQSPSSIIFSVETLYKDTVVRKYLLFKDIDEFIHFRCLNNTSIRVSTGTRTQYANLTNIHEIVHELDDTMITSRGRLCFDFDIEDDKYNSNEEFKLFRKKI